jgi:uncharacterized protein (TIGR03435 family)
MMKCVSAAAVALLAGCASWNLPAAPLSFEVASVKPAAPCCAPGQWRESKAGVDRIDFPNVTLRYCLAYAYGLKEYPISGPSWLGELRYDIVAKGPDGTRHDQLPEMMQSLLAQRFQLQAHTETKEFSVFALVVGKNGPKLTESPPPPPGDEAPGARFGMSMSPSGVGRLEAKNATMVSLANTLVRLLGHPVVDLTALTGRYDLDLEYSPEDGNGMRLATPSGGPLPATAEPGASIFGSIQQFGLRLDARKVPQNAIVVDRAEKIPTGN